MLGGLLGTGEAPGGSLKRACNSWVLGRLVEAGFCPGGSEKSSSRGCSSCAPGALFEAGEAPGDSLYFSARYAMAADVAVADVDTAVVEACLMTKG